MDKEYRVACAPEEQDSLRNSAAFLNEKINEARRRGAALDKERVAIMVALNLAHELLGNKEYENNYNDINSRVGTLQKKIDIALREIEVS